MHPSKLDAALVKKVAHLARLEISDSQAEAYASQLSVIMEHIDKLSEVKVDGVEPLTHPVEGLELRKDLPREVPSEPTKVIATAPELAGTGYKVPPIL